MHRYEFIIVIGTAERNEPALLARSVWAQSLDMAYEVLAILFRDQDVIGMIEGNGGAE